MPIGPQSKHARSVSPEFWLLVSTHSTVESSLALALGAGTNSMGGCHFLRGNTAHTRWSSRDTTNPLPPSYHSEMLPTADVLQISQPRSGTRHLLMPRSGRLYILM